MPIPLVIGGVALAGFIIGKTGALDKAFNAGTEAFNTLITAFTKKKSKDSNFIGGSKMADAQKLEKIAVFAAVAILADGTYEDSEKLAISSIAKALEVKEQEMFDAIDSEIKKVKNMSGEEEIQGYIAEHSKDLELNAAADIFQICVSIALSDGKLCAKETVILLSFAEVLGINVVYATMMIAYLVNTQPNLTVELKCEI